MKVAITVWEDRISPVFDSSRKLLIAEIKDTRITNRSHVLFDPEFPSSLAKTLGALEVPVLICGAVSQMPANVLTAGGIDLVPFITGQVEHVLNVYAQGLPLEPAFAMPGCEDCQRKTDQ